ncbi:Putative universal stress protein [Schleiferilactobacillus shenzhenensis LY-73]|uniref:Putative universal stress protein n=2 Tax=Schleiferilactobacillus shenzhenensis TaxID=1231337 RepID=U4TQG6_9LACO|nr:Putative universal stress protein [Schleiferilactobacillus shenzhenensis LY-73]
MMLQEYKRVLVAIDGSYEAELAFRKAVEVAKRNHAHLFLLHVIDTRAFQNVSSFDSAMVEQVTETQKQTMKEYVDIAKRAGLPDVSFEIEYGAPKTLIGREYPKAHDIDLIMIGATGLNAVERLLIGSVTEYVTRVATCDVLVVRTDLDNQPALVDSKHPESSIGNDDDQ